MGAMAQVKVRDLTNKTVVGLKARARRNRRSLEAELRTILDEAAQTTKGPIANDSCDKPLIEDSITPVAPERG